MNLNSLTYWFPLVKDLGIPVPKTEVLLVDADEINRTFDGSMIREEFIRTVKQSAAVIGYPLFLRTDLQSGKHGWKNTCYVPDEDRLMFGVVGVAEENMLGSCCFGPMYEALVFREFLSLESSFIAFYGDLPVNKERRYFILDGKVVCHHPYWPPDTIEGHTKDPDWHSKLAVLNEETPEEIELLSGYAERTSAVVPGYWSVDFAKTNDGKWYLIDMALGIQSYHWGLCPRSVPRRVK